MHNLLRFIKLNQFLLLFILIEGLSVALLLQNNSFQANKAIKFSTKYTSTFYRYTNAFSDYLKLKETNDYLIAENAKLHTLLQNNEQFSDSSLLRNKNFNLQHEQEETSPTLLEASPVRWSQQHTLHNCPQRISTTSPATGNSRLRSCS